MKGKGKLGRRIAGVCLISALAVSLKAGSFANCSNDNLRAISKMQAAEKNEDRQEDRACRLMDNKLDKVYTARIGSRCYSFKVQNNKLYSLGEEGKEKAEGSNASLLLENVLDVKFYNMDLKGNDELIVLTLAKDKEKDKLYNAAHLQYGEELSIYDLTLADEKPEISLKYTTNMKSMHPWKIEAGKIDDADIYANIFVGVYKDTRFYHEVMNRPFFLKWNGQFIERKWTGSYLSTHEYKDLIFLDFTGDGFDEVATLEKKEDGSYEVSLYKWLTFGFQYLMSSQAEYEGATALISMPPEKAGDMPTIWVQDQKGCEKVRFK